MVEPAGPPPMTSTSQEENTFCGGALIVEFSTWMSAYKFAVGTVFGLNHNFVYFE